MKWNEMKWNEMKWMHIGTMRNTMRTCAQYGIEGVPITIFFQWLFAIPKGSSNIRFRAETAKILEEKYNEHIKISMDGFKKDEKQDGRIAKTIWKIG
jgi:hypothetical protein